MDETAKIKILLEIQKDMKMMYIFWLRVRNDLIRTKRREILDAEIMVGLQTQLKTIQSLLIEKKVFSVEEFRDKSKIEGSKLDNELKELIPLIKNEINVLMMRNGKI